MIPDNLSFPATEAPSQSVSVHTTADSYQAASGAEWITVRQVNGSFEVLVSDNDTGAERTGTIIVTAGNADPVTVTVTQAAQDTLSVDPDALTFDYNETQESAVSVTTSADSYTASPSEDWITVRQESGTFYVSVSENTTDEVRTGTVTVSAGDADPVAVTVTQNPQDTLTVDPQTLTFSATGAEPQAVSVVTSADSFTATPQNDWITVEPQAEVFRVGVKDYAGEDTRLGAVNVQAGTAPAVEVPVVQIADRPLLPLTLSQTSLNFPATEEWDGRYITVTTAAESWEAIPSHDWILTDKRSHTQLVVKTTANDTYGQRTGFVTVSGPGTEEAVIAVSQERNW